MPEFEDCCASKATKFVEKLVVNYSNLVGIM